MLLPVDGDKICTDKVESHQAFKVTSELQDCLLRSIEHVSSTDVLACASQTKISLFSIGNR